jgi:hypothetical protein
MDYVRFLRETVRQEETTMKKIRFISSVILSIIVSMGLLVSFSPDAHALESMDEKDMRDVTAQEGLGVRLNIRFEVDSSWDNANDDSEGDGDIRIEDSDGRGGGNTGWLYFQHIYGTITPQNSGDNVIKLDANSNFIQFSQGGPFTGINLSIGDIAVQNSSTACCDPELASITIGDNAADSDNDYVDGKGSVDFHNTKLKLF